MANNDKCILFMIVLMLSFFAQAEAAYFQEPTSDFITDPSESTYELSFYSGDVSQLQGLITNARSSHPDKVLIVHIRGLIRVGDTPLTLGSKTCLSFEGCGKVVAETASAGNALIHVQDAEYVSITATENTAVATLDGRNLTETGILVTNSGKVNIDNINIYNCTEYGVDYSGRGRGLLSDAGAVTRCEISNSGISGVRVGNSTRFVLMDNISINNIYCGIDVTSQSATVVGNTCSGNQTGILIGAPSDVDGPDAVVARNELTNNTVGLHLYSGTQKHLVTENVIGQNTTGMIADGYRNHIFNNDMDNTVEFDVRGTGNIIMRHDNVLSLEVAGGTGTKFFNPPTIDNPHTDPVIVFGMGRRDLTFTQPTGGADVDLATVQSAVDSARSTYPGDYLVIWLNGTFVARGDHTGLDMPENSCVVLDGMIYPEGDGMDRNSDPDHYQKDRHTGGTQLVLMDSSGYLSFSGGTLDCRFMPAYGIYAPYSSVGLIDGVTIKEAWDNNIGVLYHGGDATPMFIRGCHLNGGGHDDPEAHYTNRGVWIHVCNYIHCISNHSEGHVADSFDFDAGGHLSTALFNVMDNEKRTGVFIEEGASNNVVVGNTITGEFGNGISLYESHGNQCENSIIVGNTITGPFGMNIRHANNTFAFNNVINTGRFGVYINVTNNYCAQTSLGDEATILFHDIPNNPLFTAPYYSDEMCDYDGNRIVNLEDFAMLAMQWFDGLGTEDLAYLTKYWLDYVASVIAYEDFDGGQMGFTSNWSGSQFGLVTNIAPGLGNSYQALGDSISEYATSCDIPGLDLSGDATYYLSCLYYATGQDQYAVLKLRNGTTPAGVPSILFRSSGWADAYTGTESTNNEIDFEVNKLYLAVLKIDCNPTGTNDEVWLNLYNLTDGDVAPSTEPVVWQTDGISSNQIANFEYSSADNIQLVGRGSIDSTFDNILVTSNWADVVATTP